MKIAVTEDRPGEIAAIDPAVALDALRDVLRRAGTPHCDALAKGHAHPDGGIDALDELAAHMQAIFDRHAAAYPETVLRALRGSP